MREIEFRAYIKDIKKIVDVYDISFLQETIGFMNPSDTQYSCRKFNEVELLQYTGLKDKNGTKIFEGDIFGDSKGQEIDVVVFEDGCFKLKSYGFIEYCLDGNAYEERWGELECEPLCNFCLEHDEILGNIYDNPELLKEELC